MRDRGVALPERVQLPPRDAPVLTRREIEEPNVVHGRV
jgi:hypothetical protein